MRFFAGPESMIAFPRASDPAAWDAMAVRWQAFCEDMWTVGGINYDAFVALYDAVPLERRTNVMIDVETPWNGILAAEQDFTHAEIAAHAGVADPLHENAALAGAWARQGRGTLDASTPVAQLKDCAITEWIDCVSYALANGSTNVIHYGSHPSNFSEHAHAVGGLRLPTSDGKATLRSYCGADAVYFRTLAQRVADGSNANSGMADMMRAHDGATAEAFALYPFRINGEDWPAIMALMRNAYGYGAFKRYLANSTTAVGSGDPEYVPADERAWVRATVAAMVPAYRLARDNAAAIDSDLIERAQRPVAAIMFLSPPSPDFTYHADFGASHMIGAWDDDPATAAADMIGALFGDADADTPVVGPPDQVWLWDAATYYWGSLAFDTRSVAAAQYRPQMDRLRVAILKRWFGLPKLGVAEAALIGSRDWAAQDAWYLAWSGGDTIFANSNPTAAWRDATGAVHGSLTALGCTVDFDGPTAELAQYFTAGQVAGTQTIAQTDISLAVRKGISEYILRVGEIGAELAAAAEADAIDYGDGSAVIPAYSIAPGAVPTPRTLITQADGSVRALRSRELLVSPNADGETARAYVLSSDATAILRVVSGDDGVGGGRAE